MELISRDKAIVQLSHNKIGDDDCDVIIHRDIETVKGLPSAFEGMTNGEVIKALFPKAKIFENESNIKYQYVDVFLYSENHMNCYTKEWWNSPYQKGGEGDKG